MAAIKFEFIAGCLSLSFVDTLGGRGGVPVERLAAPQDLVDWLAAAGLPLPPASLVDGSDLLEARELREAIHLCGLATISGKHLPEGALELLNRSAARPPLRPRLCGNSLSWEAKRPREAALSTIAADALMTLAPPVAGRIRLCPECRMMFVDNSRPGRRRWCSSTSGCGNRAKVRGHRERAAKNERKATS